MGKKLVIKDGVVDNIIEAPEDFTIEGCELVDATEGADIGFVWDGTDVVIPAPVAPTEEALRLKRNALLKSSDWTQVADAPVDATAWATYRTALRDITTHANWPNLEEADWPTKP